MRPVGEAMRHIHSPTAAAVSAERSKLNAMAPSLKRILISLPGCTASAVNPEVRKM
jgi:hypothetical protein